MEDVKMSAVKAKKKKEHSIDDSESSPKRTKVDFTEIDFKHSLKDPNTTFLALEKFSDSAKQWNPGEGCDIVSAYCQSSPECSEIFKVLDVEKRKPAEIYSVFAVLECILLRVLDGGDVYTAVGQNIVQRMLSGHMHQVYFTLQMNNKPGHIKMTLKLLTAMVMLNEQSARAIMTQFDFTHKIIYPLFNRRDRKDPKDVRTCLIHFVISFMMTGSDSIIKQFMEHTAFISSIFQGLNLDNAQTVHLVLNTILVKVVRNPVISKTQKVKLLDGASLGHIAQLYHWTGALSWQDKSEIGVVKIEDRTEDQTTVIKAVHTFLLEICCSQKNGINFFDKSFGTSKKNQNHIMTGVLTSLIKVVEVPEMQDLVVKTLRVCPDQIQHFLATLLHSLSPRPSAKWLAAVLVLRKIFEGQPDRPAVLKLKERVSVNKFCDMAVVGVIPPSQVLHTVLQAVKHKHVSVRHAAMDLIGLILQRVLITLRQLEQDNGLQALYSAGEILDILNNVKEATVKAVPDIQTIFTCWDKLTTSDVKDVPMDTDDGSHIAIDVVSDSDHMIKLQEVLCLYQELFPLVLVDSPDNVNKLLEGVRKLSEQQVVQESELTDDVMLRQLNMLNILSGTDARKLPWNKESSDGHSLMYLLLEMLSRTQSLNDNNLTNTASHLVSQLLYNTGLFDNQMEELNIWIGHFAAVTKETGPSNETSTVIDYLAKVFTSVIVNPYSHTDKVNEFMSEGIAMETSGCNLETMSTSTNDIDGILDLDEGDLLESSSLEIETSLEGEAFRFPFSPLLIVALENLNKMDIKTKCLSDLVSMVVIDVFHLQLQPLPLACLLRSCHGDDGVVEKHIVHYILSWLTDNKQKTKKVKAPVGTLQYMSNEELVRVYCKPSLATNTDFVHNLLDSLRNVAKENRLLVTRQTLLYISSAIEQYSKDEQEVDALLNVLFQALSTIIQTCVTEPEADGIDSKDNSANAKLLINLCQRSQRSRSQYLQQVLQVVLSHSLLTKWFLYDESDPLTALPSNKKAHLMELITTQMSNIFCNLADVELKEFRTHLTRYFEKIRHHLHAVVKQGSEVQGQMEMLVKVTQNCMSVFNKYLDPEDHTKLLHSLLSLPGTYLIDQASSSLTPVGNLMSSLVDTILLNCHGNDLHLNCEDVKTLFCHMTACRDLSDVCYKILYQHPNFSVVLNERVLNFLLSCPFPSATEMISIAIQHNSVVRKQFEKWINGNNAKKNKSSLKSVGTTYLKCLLQGNVTDNQGAAQRIYEIYREDLLLLHKNTTDVSCQMFICLHKLGMIDTEEQKEVCGHLVGAVKDKSIVKPAQIRVLQQLSSTADVPVLSRSQLYSVCRQCLMYTAKDNGELQQHLLRTLCQFTQEEVESFTKEMLAKDFMAFTKSCLKSLFTDRHTFQVLSILVKSVFREGSKIEPDLDLVITMTMSHSLFLPIMFREKYPDTREWLIDFVLTLSEVCPRMCSPHHIGIYLGSYGATLSFADQKLLKLLHWYEKNDVCMTDYRPYLWGPKAVEHHSVKKTLGSSLWKQPTTEHVMECIDTEKLNRSIVKFPLLRKLQPDQLQAASDCKSEGDLYDPCFILPLFSNLLSPDSLVDCRLFVEKNCLGFTMAALSSHNSETRGAAYHVLSRYLHHLEGGRFPEQQQILYLVQLLQDSVEKPNNKLPCIITVFLARVAQLLLKPDEHMYSVINSFLLLKPTLDVGNVPEFYKLFNSSALEFKVERSWILSLFVDGLRETADYRIFERLYVFKLLLSYQDSTISDKNTQLQVLRLLRNASVERTVTVDLVKRHGILSWLSGVISSLKDDDLAKVDIVTDVLHTLWFSMAKDSYRDRSEQHTQRLVSLAITREVCLCLKQLLRHYGKDTQPAVYLKFLQTLESVLRNLQSAVNAAEEKGHSIRTGVLTIQDICLVLISSAGFHKDLHTVDTCTEALECLKSTINPRHRESRRSKTEISGNLKPDIDMRSTDGNVEDLMNVDEDESTSKDKSAVESILALTVSVCTHWSAWSCGGNELPSHDQVNNSTEAVTCLVVFTSALYCSNLVPSLPMNIIQILFKWLHKHFVCQNKMIKHSLSVIQVEHFSSRLLNCYQKLFSLEKEYDQKHCSEVSVEKQKNKDLGVDQTDTVKDLGRSLRILNEVLHSITTKQTRSESVDWKTFTDKVNLTDLSSEDFSCILRQYCLGAATNIQTQDVHDTVIKTQAKTGKRKSTGHKQTHCK